MNSILPLEDIFAYADDILILTDNVDSLKRCIKIIEDWSANNSLIINTSKSAVMEFVHRKKKITNLKVGDTFMNYPIVEQYKYLGTWLNQKLTVDTQLQHINKKSQFIRYRLSPTLYNATLDFRRNLWQIFILPLYEFTIPIYHYEEAHSNKMRVELSLRRSFKSFTGLRKTTNTELINDLMAYDIQERSKLLSYLSEKKWKYRLKGESYKSYKDTSFIAPELPPNLCKNQPKSMIKYINMQTSLCHVCAHVSDQNYFKNNKRCSQSHLKEFHNIEIDSIYSIAEKVMKLTESQKNKKKGDTSKMNRKQLVKYAEELIEPNLNKIKAFFSQKEG